jgi:hypothetical protein
MLDDELRRLLDKAPDVTATVDELFELARRKCEDRYFVTIVDVV